MENNYKYLNKCFPLTERTEKVPLGSIKKIVSEPIKGHEEYYIMVCYMRIALTATLLLYCVCRDFNLVLQSCLGIGFTGCQRNM